jgi:hypothetical protein
MSRRGSSENNNLPLSNLLPVKTHALRGEQNED